MLSRIRRMRAALVTFAILGALTIAVSLRDPHVEGSWGICPFAAIGIYCPGCGGLRAVYDLTHGRLLEAASSNLLFVVSLPFVLAGLARWAWTGWSGVRLKVHSPTAVKFTVGMALLMLGFVIARNLPGSWLAP